MEYYNLFVKVMNDFQENYSYLKYKKYSVVELIRQFSEKFQNIQSYELFIEGLVDVLKLLEDLHISLTDNKRNKYYNTYNFNLVQNFNYELLFEKYFQNKFIIKNKAGVVGYYNDVLYVNFFTWGNHLEKEIREMLNIVENELEKKQVKKIVIDVRSNFGGNDALSRILLSYFVPKNIKILVTRYLFRLDKNDPNKIGNETDIYQEENPRIYSNATLCVLIGNNCMSSNEYMIKGFKALHNYNDEFKSRIFLVGDKTLGSSGCPKLFKYASDFEIRIPSWICFTPEGKLFEGEGVKPDVFIDSKKSIVRNKDKVFEKALEIISK